MTTDEPREALKLALRLQALLEPAKHIGHKQQAREICAKLIEELKWDERMELEYRRAIAKEFNNLAWEREQGQ